MLQNRPRLMLPLITKWPPSASMVNAAMLAVKVITGISPAKSLNIDKPKSFAFVFASRNLSYSSCCEFITRINAAPKILSLITLFSQSITARLCINNALTFFNTKKNVTPIIGIMAITHKASFQLMVSNKMLAPIMINNDEQ